MFEPPADYTTLGPGRSEPMRDEDDNLLQFAIQQSLLDAGTESDQVRVKLMLPCFFLSFLSSFTVSLLFHLLAASLHILPSLVCLSPMLKLIFRCSFSLFIPKPLNIFTANVNFFLVVVSPFSSI